MSEYNFWLQVKCDNFKKIEVLKAKFEKDESFPNICQPAIIESTSDSICLLWDVSVAEETDEENYDIAVLLNFLFEEGTKEVYGLYQNEHDESGMGDFIFIDNNIKINPELFELNDIVIYSGEENGSSIFKENGIPSSSDDEYLINIDVDNIVQCFTCIAAAHKEGLLKKGISKSSNYENEDKEIDVFVSLFKGDLSAIKRYIDNGSDLNIHNSDGDGETALMCASNDGLFEVCTLLIEAGADANAKNYEGETALMYAIEEGHIEVCSLLIEAGADIDAKDEIGQTALMWAASEGNSIITKLLIEAGADVNVKSEEGATALSLASQNKHYEIIKIIENIDEKNC